MLLSGIVALTQILHGASAKEKAPSRLELQKVGKAPLGPSTSSWGGGMPLSDLKGFVLFFHCEEPSEVEWINHCFLLCFQGQFILTHEAAL